MHITIAYRIYSGETAEQVGITPVGYASRKETLDRFLATAPPLMDFDAEYVQWLRGDIAGQRGENIVSSSRKEETPIDTTSCCGKTPTVADQIKSASKAALRYARSGGKLVNDEIYQTRIGICRACEFLHGGRCSRCGCFMRLKAKLPAEKCRVGKW